MLGSIIFDKSDGQTRVPFAWLRISNVIAVDKKYFRVKSKFFGWRR
jgi:hypothetical protein